MIKVIFVFIAATALMAYFLRDTLLGDGVTEKTGIKSFERIASLPGEISESSGVVALFGQNQFLTHNDAGNKPYLYKLNSRGNIQEIIKLKLPNVDWEDLAMDNEGNIYIADTGNNNNGRKELAVYKINLNSPSKVEAIRFTYEDQKKYPPPKKERNFDSEAAFWADGNIYLISKDRGRGELAKVYRLPDKAGQYKAQLIGSHRIKAQITGAAISPDAETVVLLSEEKLHIFSDFSSPDKFYEGSYKEVELDDAGQTEGVAFEDDASLIITSEGGSLYRYKL